MLRHPIPQEKNTQVRLLSCDPQRDPFDRSLRFRLGKNLIEALC
jgi:hypothetical protein